MAGRRSNKMTERDWQKDWEMCQRATSGKWEEGGTWYGVRMVAWKEDAEFIAAAREALPFWLQRVREVEIFKDERGLEND